MSKEEKTSQNGGFKGLTSAEAARLLEENGYNELAGEKKKSVFIVFLEQFKDFLVIILLAAAVISAVLGDAESAIVIFAVITMNAILGTVQHVKAQHSLESLKALSAPSAKVIRDGMKIEIPSREVVVGDILMIEAGDMISADGDIIENVDLKVNESILTGESEKMSDVKYIGEACKIARKYFKVIGLEVYPTNSENYAYWHECGADYVTVFQETYNSDKYETLHLAGKKRIFPYRLNAQERALKGGMRGVGFAALLGLDDFRKDAFATGIHAYLLQRKYPQAEIAFSCPRLRPIINNDRINPMDVHEAQLLQVVCAYRLLLPFASITVSTRECKRVRDNLIQICATKISAGVDVGIGGRSGEEQGDEQFEIDDTRNVQEVYDAILEHGLQPVMSDYIYV